VIDELRYTLDDESTEVSTIARKVLKDLGILDTHKNLVMRYETPLYAKSRTFL